MDDLEYGPVFVFQGRHKGRVFYYDDDLTVKTAICYVGHPLDFVGSIDIPIRFLREPTIDDMMNRLDTLWRELSTIARDGLDYADSVHIYQLWSERLMIHNTLNERRMLGSLDKIEGDKNVFLCHSSSDKGTVRMVHDDLKNLGVNVWLDENKIKVGDSIVGKISTGLSESQIMMVFLSEKSVESIWVKKEWQSFLARQLSGNNLQIFPVLIERCAIPSIIADLKYADFTESYYDGLKEIYQALR